MVLWFDMYVRNVPFDVDFDENTVGLYLVSFIHTEKSNKPKRERERAKWIWGKGCVLPNRSEKYALHT